MSRKIRIFINRLKTMSFKKMFMMINQIHKEHHKSRIVTFIDMIICALKFGVGYQDYRVFGFAIVPRKKRTTFMTMNQNLSLVRQVNNPEYFRLFNNKILFFERFNEYIRRDWINLEGKTADDLRAFCEGRERVFAKQTETFGGQGISQVKLNESTDYEKLFAELSENKQFLIEEAITQHPKMNELYNGSVNTLRMVTLVKDGKSVLMYSLVRMGQGGAAIDNITSGGMYAPLSEEGVITHPAFCDREGVCHDVHPTSGTAFVGFKVPFFKEAVELVREASLVEPEMKYIGWDVAITPDGPILVEGNNFPSYELPQNYRHRDNDEGIRAKFEEVMGIKL